MALIVCGLLAVLAVGKEVGKKPQREIKESWVEEKMLSDVDNFQLLPREFGSKISYKMSPDSYAVLNPIGIACQVMQDDAGRQIDVVVISGRSMEAFHDQQICFRAQGWDLLDQGERTIQTNSHGKIPAAWMKIQQRGQLPRNAVYLFRTGEGFSSYGKAKWDFLFGTVKRPFQEQIGFSYRFIGLTPDVSEADLDKFAGEYLDKLDESTKGVM
ncbi:MAG: exosortase-associated EpsI family protein [Fimbriimonadaceae bacterium]